LPAVGARRNATRFRPLGDDVLALIGGEETVGDGKPVDQQCEIEFLPTRPDPPAVGREFGELVIQDQLRIVSRRPISADLPSSTLPQGMTRRSDFCWWRST